MAFVSSLLDLSTSQVPCNSADLNAHWFKQSVNRTEQVLMQMREGGHYMRLLCGLKVAADGEPVVDGLGQFILTDNRILGMIDKGKYGDSKIGINRQKVYGFSFDYDDALAPRPQTNRRGKAVSARFFARPKQERKFEIYIYSVAASIRDEGTVNLNVNMEVFMMFFDHNGRPTLWKS